MVISICNEIEHIRFDLIGWKMRDSNNCSFSDDEVEFAIGEYKRFITLKVENPSARLSPTKMMDEAWHYHILDTKRYAKDCQVLYGDFVHHSPSYGPLDSEEKQTVLEESFKRMYELYKQRFDSNPISCRASCGHCNSGGTGCESCGDD
jgi:hypothetical protein